MIKTKAAGALWLLLAPVFMLSACSNDGIGRIKMNDIEFTCDITKFQTQEREGGVKIVGYTGDDENLYIPEEIDGKSVIEIDTTVIFDDEIDYDNLPEFNDMERVYIPSTVKTISYDSFKFRCKYMVVDENNTDYSSVDGMLFSKDKSTLLAIPNDYGTTIDILEGTVTAKDIVCDSC